MKIVINGCYGGFGLSHEAVLRYYELKGQKVYAIKDKFDDWIYSTVPEDEYNRLHREAYSGEKRDFTKFNAVYLSYYNMERNDPALIQVIEEMGSAASGQFSELHIVNIPDDVKWEIQEYDGCEHIAEVHRTWS